MMVQEAYRHIETENNPLLKEARKKATSTYDNTASTINSKFKSRRPENKGAFYNEEDNQGGHH